MEPDKGQTTVQQQTQHSAATLLISFSPPFYFVADLYTAITHKFIRVKVINNSSNGKAGKGRDFYFILKNHKLRVLNLHDKKDQEGTKNSGVGCEARHLNLLDNNNKNSMKTASSASLEETLVNLRPLNDLDEMMVTKTVKCT